MGNNSYKESWNNFGLNVSNVVLYHAEHFGHYILPAIYITDFEI